MSTVIIILMILALIFGAWTAFSMEWNVFFKILGTLIISLVYFFFCGGIIIIALDGTLYSIADKKETPFKTNIYGINMKSTVQGQTFFLGCGNVDNDYRYSYYVKFGTKQSFKLDDVSAKKTVIIEDEEVQPYILKWKKVEIVNKKAWKSWLLDEDKNEEMDNIEIHVPKGTIVQEFKGRL
jgi:hypothetical protein